MSQASRHDIIAVLGEPACRLAVVPNFVAADFAHRLRQARAEAAHPDQLRRRFLLAVGVYIPTKNIPRLVRAYRLARADAPDTVPPELVLTGRIGWERGFPLNGAADITTLGHVSDQLLAQLYATCAAFVYEVGRRARYQWTRPGEPGSDGALLRRRPLRTVHATCHRTRPRQAP